MLITNAEVVNKQGCLYCLPQHSQVEVHPQAVAVRKALTVAVL